MGRRQQISGQFESWTAMKGFAERLGNVGVVRGLELLISTLRRHVNDGLDLVWRAGCIKYFAPLRLSVNIRPAQRRALTP